MDLVDICEVPGCENEAEHMTSTETNYIQICKDCYNKKYKK